MEKESFLERSECELLRLARETAALPISLICGYAGKAPEDAGRRATNSAAILQHGQIVFRQTKMLLLASAAADLRAMQELPHL